MASKNIDFTKRLEKAIKETGLKKTEFARKAGIQYKTLMNYLIPKGTGRVPVWDQLVKIAKAARKSTDWLLLGETPLVYTPIIVPRETDQEKIRTACRQVKEILTSDNILIKSSLLTDLAALHYHLRKEKMQDRQIRILSCSVEQMKAKCKAVKRSME